ncbi:MAG: hypothetical protein WBA67_09140 [Jannaschia sp.]
MRKVGILLLRATRAFALLVLGVLSLLPVQANAEGGVQRIACVGGPVCDVAGLCAGQGDDVSFTLAPLDVGPQGAGKYRLTRDGRQTEAFMRPDMTLLWAEAREGLQMLVLLEDSAALLVTRATDQGGASKVAFLTCEETG